MKLPMRGMRIVVLGVWLVCAPALSLPAFAAHLLSANASVKAGGQTLLALTFDDAVPLSLLTPEGNTIQLASGPVDADSASVRTAGLVKRLKASGDALSIEMRHYARARIIPAGAGTYLVLFERTAEPKPIEPTPSKPKVKSQKTPASSSSESPLVDTPIKRREGSSQGSSGGGERGTPPSGQAMHERSGQTPVAASQSAENAPGGTGTPVTAVPKTSSEPAHHLYLAGTPNDSLPSTIRMARDIAEQGDPSRAITLLESIQQDESTYGWSRMLLGAILERQGQYSRALDNYREALLDVKTEGIAAVRIALVFQTLGNQEAASDMWLKVLEMGGGKLYLPSGTQMASSSGSQEQREDKGVAGLFANRSVVLILAIVGGILLLGGAGGGGYLLARAKKRRKMGDEGEFVLENGLGNHEGIEGDGEGAPPGKRVARMYEDQKGGGAASGPDDDDLAGLEGDLASLGSPEEMDDGQGEAPLSDAKRKKVLAMHQQGATVREIAETLGVGQDEVRMAINLTEA